jgi:hypothetical protein
MKTLRVTTYLLLMASGLFLVALLWVRSWGGSGWAQIGAAEYLGWIFYALAVLVPINTFLATFVVIKKKPGSMECLLVSLASIIILGVVVVL